MTTPIVIMSFNRPNYMERLCESLKLQYRAVDEKSLFLMQDWAQSERTGCIYASETDLQDSVRVFRSAFPRGNVICAPSNLGIALNFERAERFVFRELGADVAYFFEDDLVLGRRYLSILDSIWEAGSDLPELGYFACYGDSQLAFVDDKVKFIPLEHHWGFGLTRRCWEAMQSWIDPFYNIYRRVDYKWRPHLSILRAFFNKDVAWNGTSQDVIKTAACASLGYARINTDACFAKYIGESGQSFTPELYRSLGLGNSEISENTDLKIEPLDSVSLQKFIDSKAAEMRSFRRHNLHDTISNFSRDLADPERMASREDIDKLWWSIMDRLPEEEYYEANIGLIPFWEVRSNLLVSQEARAKSRNFG